MCLGVHEPVTSIRCSCAVLFVLFMDVGLVTLVDDFSLLSLLSRASQY